MPSKIAGTIERRASIKTFAYASQLENRKSDHRGMYGRKAIVFKTFQTAPACTVWHFPQVEALARRVLQ